MGFNSTFKGLNNQYKNIVNTEYDTCQELMTTWCLNILDTSNSVKIDIWENNGNAFRSNVR